MQRPPGGHWGSGKQSLTRLAAYATGAYTFQVTLTKQYNLTNFLEDIKELYRTSGLKGKKVCFIFTDADIKDESFLEYINQLLMTGEISGLFPKDELDAILGDIRPIMKKEAPSVVDTVENLSKFFFDRVRANLHVCLCFSPVGPKFSQRALQFPGLINGCTIDWFLPWPVEALTAVSSKFITDFKIECTDEVKAKLIEMMATVHTSVSDACETYYNKFRKRRYVTPKSYLSFIAGYKMLYTNKFDEVMELANKVNGGLEKLDEAKKDISKMRNEIIVKNQELEVAQKESVRLLSEISESTAIAEKEKKKVQSIMESVSKKAAEINLVKTEAERDLAAAKPALDAALNALNSISPKDIGALKALKKPPSIVKRIFDCVIVLRRFPLKQVTWIDDKNGKIIDGSYDVSLKMMSDLGFLGALMNFPKEYMTDEDVELLQPYTSAPDFNFDAAKKASGNVAGLCSWAQAMVTYHHVAKVVTPKIDALRSAEAELKIATRRRPWRRRTPALFRRSLTPCRRHLTRPWPTSRGSRTRPLPIRGRWTRQTLSWAPSVERRPGGPSRARSLRRRLRSLSETVPLPAPSCPTWDPSTRSTVSSS